MKYKVLQRFLTKKSIYTPGDIYEHPNPGRFTKNLVKYGFIEQVSTYDYLKDWEKNGIRSKLTGLIIAPRDYAEGGKKHFTFEEALQINRELKDGWRLPTRSEWALICEEFGQKDGELDADTLVNNLTLGKNGYVYSGSLYCAGSYGNYWSSTANSSTNAYYLLFHSSSVYPSLSNYRYFGRSVRCVRSIDGRVI